MKSDANSGPALILFETENFAKLFEILFANNTRDKMAGQICLVCVIALLEQ
jgi:hypothetical protein